jgi:VPDSG-CTERM exosortase interaction domain
MSIKKLLATAALAIPMAFGSMAAHAVSSTGLNGVTFTFTAIDADSVTLEITGALSATGNWTNAAFLWTLGLNPSGDFTSASIIPDATFSGKELNDSGCTGGLSGKACFTYNPLLALTDDMLFTINFANYTGDFTVNDIFGVKVGFICTDDGTATGNITSLDQQGNLSACGSLMSQDTTESSSSSSSGPDTSSSSSSGPDTSSSSSTGAVPESGSTLTLLGLGLLGLGFTRRMKKTA